MTAKTSEHVRHSQVLDALATPEARRSQSRLLFPPEREIRQYGGVDGDLCVVLDKLVSIWLVEQRVDAFEAESALLRLSAAIAVARRDGLFFLDRASEALDAARKESDRPMNRKERRRLRAIKGGAAPELPHVRKQNDATPGGRLFNALDRAVRAQLVADPDLDLGTAVGALLRFAANVSAAHASEAGALDDLGLGYGEACQRIFDEEADAVRERRPKSVPGTES